MRILVLTNKLPYPPRDGGSIATLNMLTGLRDAGNQVTCLSIITSKHSFPVKDIPAEFSETIRFLGVRRNTSVRIIPLLLNFLFSRYPYNAVRFNFRRYRKRLLKLLQSETFDLVQLEGPYMGFYLDTLRRWSKAPVSLRAHNVENRIWNRKANREISRVKRGYLTNMASRLERFENKIMQQCDLLVAISPLDEAYFQEQGFDGVSIVIPTGMNLNEYKQVPIPGEQTLFFIGALDWLPNQEGITWFLEKVMDLVLEKIPDASLHIAGRNAPDSFVRSLNHPGIVYHGEVEDSRAFMGSFRVMVAPLFTGSGIRIKILEAMALGRPVVTTPIGIEGIEARNETEVRVSDNPETFRDQVVKLLSDENEVSRQTTSAFRLVQDNFDTFELSTRLSQFFKEQV